MAHRNGSVENARLYAATGNGIVRIDETAGWQSELTLDRSGAQCLAVDPRDADTVYAGLRSGGVRKTDDGGRTWTDCELPEPAVYSLAVSAADGAVYAGAILAAIAVGDESREELALPERPFRRPAQQRMAVVRDRSAEQVGAIEQRPQDVGRRVALSELDDSEPDLVRESGALLEPFELHDLAPSSKLRAFSTCA